MSTKPTARTVTEKTVFELDAGEVAELVHKQLVLEHPNLVNATSDTMFTCSGFDSELRRVKITFAKTVEV